MNVQSDLIGELELEALEFFFKTRVLELEFHEAAANLQLVLLCHEQRGRQISLVVRFSAVTRLQLLESILQTFVPIANLHLHSYTI